MNYRPYKSIDELISDYIVRENTILNNAFKTLPLFSLPIIWVKNKKYKNRVCISGFDESDIVQYVMMDGYPYSLESLFRDFTFLDASPCGKKI